jgi:hypothetical protein
VKIHPYELSYYNEWIGGPRGASRAGFELSYWYDAYNDQTIAEINERLPPGATVDFLTTMTTPETFTLLQELGHLRSDVVLGLRDSITFPYVWLLTQDSKATTFTRLLFAMKPWFESRPRQLDGLRVASVADPVAVSRAWALELLVSAPSGGRAEAPAAPTWVRDHVPWLASFWGDGVAKVKRPTMDNRCFEWANRDPAGLRSAARQIASGRASLDDDARRLLAIVKRYDPVETPGRRSSERLLRGRPQALVEAVEVLITRPADLRTVLSRYGYTGQGVIARFLDEGPP